MSAASTAVEEAKPLLPTVKPSKWRFVALGVFAVVSCTQCITWFTFSMSRPAFFEEFFGITRSELDLLLNYGPIFFLPFAPLVSWMLTLRNGLRKTEIFGAVLACAGACIRLVPCFVASPAARHSLGMRIFLHIGQALNAAAGPVAMSPVSLLSSRWFPLSERTTATSFAFLSNTSGVAIGFLLGPALVPDSASAPRIIYLEAALSIFALLAALFLFPTDPPQPVQQQQQLSVQTEAVAAAASTSSVPPPPPPQQSFFKGVLACVKSPSTMLAVFAAGVQSGLYSSWAGLLLQILEPLSYTPSQAGWFGFGSTAGTVLGAAVVGFVADKWFVRRMKRMLLVIWGACIALFTWFTLSLPSPAFPNPPIPSNAASIGIAVALGGLFQGAIDPPLYELAAEASFPVHESTSASLITFTWNVATLLMLFVAPHIPVEIYNTLLVSSFVLCALLTIVMREHYRRRDAVGSPGNSSSDSSNTVVAIATATTIQ